MKYKFNFGVKVKIKETVETKSINLDGKHGTVFGETIPSETNIQFIGDQSNDYAVNICIDDTDETFWFSNELIELLNRESKTVIKIGEEILKKDNKKWLSNKPKSLFKKLFNKKIGQRIK